MKTGSTSNSPAHAKSVSLDQLGEYPAVRTLATEILQSDDFSSGRQAEFVLKARQAVQAAPRYWLAHSVLALACWVKGEKEACRQAVATSEELDAMKTALFWTLVCQRAGRTEAAAQWLQRYITQQNADDLEDECLILIDAYTNGLLGDNSCGKLVSQLKAWFEEQSQNQTQVDQATDIWLAYFRSIRTRLLANEYPYLRQYSPVWPDLKEAMEAQISQDKISRFLQRIKAAESSPEAVAQRLDKTLLALLSRESQEELDLANKATHTAKLSYLQLLAQAGTNRGKVHVSGLMQRHALYLSRKWALTAYNCMLLDAQYTMRRPIDLLIGEFHGTTADGRNRQELTAEYDAWLEHEKRIGMESHTMSCGYILLVLGSAGAYYICQGIGLANDAGFAITGNWILLLVIFTWVAWYFIRKSDKNKAKKDQAVREKLDKTRLNNIKILRTTLDDIITLQATFASAAHNHKSVQECIKDMSP